MRNLAQLNEGRGCGGQFFGSLSLKVFMLLLTVSVLYIKGGRCYAQESEEILDPSSSRPVVVELPDLGRVQGRRQGAVDFFGGLPYAAPPVGALRWAPPEPATPWAPATLDATHFGPDCWQTVDPLMNPHVDPAHMSEDCLYLNVFTPAGHAATRRRHRPRQQHYPDLLPVMVWLHGGAFQMGGARRPEYDGRRLAERGTVVVTLNYRLGALGFLVSSPDGVMGNFGLMDQRAALHWVQDYILHFGGDPTRVTLFGESAGAVMTVLHLMMDGAGTLFHKAIIQSNPLGFQFRSVVIADFIGDALKRNVDCRDLACLRAERVEEILVAQSSLMGVPRSVGDFFTWGPVLTQELQLTFGAQARTPSNAGAYRTSSSVPFASSSTTSTLPASFLATSRENIMFRNVDSWRQSQRGRRRHSAWAEVNVSEPLKNIHLIPDNIPIIIGVNKHEGEMFAHGAFPITMTKAVYWMFVGALFRDSASRILKHYRGYVDQIEKAAEDLARKQIEEEENKQYYLEHREKLDHAYEQALSFLKNSSLAVVENETEVNALVRTWSRGGNSFLINDSVRGGDQIPWHKRFWPFGNLTESEGKMRQRLERRKTRAKERALREAAKVVVDYRPVMSRIIGDYLFRCPSWHLANRLSRNRFERGAANNIYMYQFSHSTHIPGFKECWGKSCHTAEVPYAFEAMEVIRSNYSTLGPYAQKEAPTAASYPYSDRLSSYRDAVEAAFYAKDSIQHLPPPKEESNHTSPYSLSFQQLLDSLFGDYFKQDADEEIANDMAERWVAFATKNNPNHEDSQTLWQPWRPDEDADIFGDDLRKSLRPDIFDEIFDADVSDDSQKEDNATSAIGAFAWVEDPVGRIIRKKVLAALGMQVAEEDVFQTLLRRLDLEEPQESSLNRLFFGSASTKPKQQGLNRRTLRQIRLIAQEMGLLGNGLRGEARRGLAGGGPFHQHNMDEWREDFFPEILELKWPPEARLVERDCTCDMWDRIRYRY